jgi:hypothetical protein
VEWFYRQRPRLEAAGFPAPMPGCGLRWDPAAVAAWQDAQLAPHATQDPARQAEQLLIQRALAMTHGGVVE